MDFPSFSSFPIEFVKVKNDDDFKNIAVNIGGNALLVTVAAVALSTLAKLVLIGGSLISFIAMPLIIAAGLVYAGTVLADKLFDETDLSMKTARPMPSASKAENLDELKSATTVNG